MTAGYDTLIVTFSDPIKVLDNMFSDAVVVFGVGVAYASALYHLHL